ncbi:HXXXD-type acyl-transferase family protein [Citrus sinensis]|nr:HXXXD-type acyl-transferase family protein [Citrus sinensis]
MELLQASADGKLEVKPTGKSIVKAMGPLPEPHTLQLSNLDLLSGRFPFTYFYFYRRPFGKNYPLIIQTLRISLAKTLNFYYPFAGRIIQNPQTNEPEIICDKNGALVLEAEANIPLVNLDFYNLNESLQGKLVSIQPDFPLQIQVTSYTCGGISITFSFDHALGDASSFGKFLVSWSEIAQQKPITCSPDLRRNLRARFPPSYHPSLDQTFVKCTIEEISNIPPTNILLKRFYHIDASSISRLQQLASVNGKKRTKVEAFSAYIWKIMVTSIDEKHGKCKMASVTELKQGSISEIASRVHDSITKVTNEAHFLDLIDWIECHRPGLMLARVVLGRDGPAVLMSSGRRFPVVELDFGFGSPVLGAVSSIIERSGVGYINQRPSAKCDGSWTVSAILWPELATALESDFIFQPMSSADHLQL